MLKTSDDLNFNPIDMMITTNNRSIKIVFSKYNPISPVFEESNLKGQLECQGYSVSRSGTNVTFVFKKATKEKWGQLVNRSKTTGPAKQDSFKTTDSDKLTPLPKQYLELETPRQLQSVLNERDIHGMSRPSNLGSFNSVS